MKKILIICSVLVSFISEIKAVKLFLPAANELEITSSSISHKTGFKIQDKDLMAYLADSPEIQGPTGIGVEKARRLVVEYSAKFKIGDEKTRIRFCLCKEVDDATQWIVKTPTTTRLVADGDWEEEIDDFQCVNKYYFRSLTKKEEKERKAEKEEKMRLL